MLEQKIDKFKIIKCNYNMNRLDYYNRQKDAWDDNEIQNLRTEYETNEMTIAEIADIHRRTPGSISHKLKNIDIISHYTISRGYSEYKNSDLYKEIVEVGKKSDAEKKEKKEMKEATLKEETDSSYVIMKNREIIEMRREIAELKRDVKEILRLMNALYDFEQQ